MTQPARSSLRQWIEELGTGRGIQRMLWEGYTLSLIAERLEMSQACCERLLLQFIVYDGATDPGGINGPVNDSAQCAAKLHNCGTFPQRESHIRPLVERLETDAERAADLSVPFPYGCGLGAVSL